MKRLLSSLLIVASPLGAAEISPADVQNMASVDVVFLGEVHDNPHHHANQTEMLKELAPAAVVFEMLTPEQGEIVTPALLQDKAALEAALDWANGGWPDFAMYYPIFAAAEGTKIFGAQVTREAARAAIMDGDIPGLFGEDATRFGLTADLPQEQQQTREAKQMEAHCNALPESMLSGMVLVQRLRDATLARAIVQAHEATDGPVVVITGNGHARMDWGAPALLPDELRVLTVAQFESASEGDEPFDYWIVTDPVEREDPCKAFE